MAEVFTQNGHTNFETGKIKLVVNGDNKGEVDREATLGAFASKYAKQYGLRNFAVFVDGEKQFTENSGDSIEGATSIELVPKDARGGC